MTVKQLIDQLSTIKEDLEVTFPNDDLYENGRYSIDVVVDMEDGTLLLGSALYHRVDDVTYNFDEVTCDY